MSGTQKSFGQIVEDFNQTAITNFNKQYESLEPELAGLAFKYNSGNVAQSNIFINHLFSTVLDWKGTQPYKSIDDVTKQSIVHKEKCIEGLEIPNREFKRAQSANNVTGLDMYIKSISAQAKQAKDAPFEEVLDLLEAGASDTYGTCFDNQNMFDTTHAFDSSAGSQSNLLTGAGATLAQLSSDMKRAVAALRGFYYSVDKADSANKKKRMLNKGNLNLVVVCDPSLSSLFDDLRTIENIVVDSNGGSQTNSLRNTFSVVVRPMTDTNDWYVIDTSDPLVRPIMISMEDEGKLITPQDNPEALANLQALRYAYNQMSYGLAYGAWWKAVKVSNA